MAKKVKIWGYKCERCGHEWRPRDIEKPPTCCPGCHSPYWHTPRKAEKSLKKGAKDR